jgi:ABC-type antimicrobial peptide transport system permease subunit
VGLYGLAARRAAERGREFGIRLALGARPESLRRLVLEDTGLIVGAGLLVGLPAAGAAAYAIRSWLFGVSSTAPHVFLFAAIVLASVAFVASFLPIRRAGRLDPVRALRD